MLLPVFDAQTGQTTCVEVEQEEYNEPVQPPDTESDLERLDRLERELAELRQKLGG